MVILSLDISTRSTGYAITEDGILLDYGTLKSSNSDYLKRGFEIREQLLYVLKNFTPDVVVVEELKVLTNQKVLVKLGIVNGILLSLFSTTPILFIPPSVWRSEYGLNKKRKEAKKQAIEIASNFSEVKNDDEAEAILIGLAKKTRFLVKKCVW